MQAQYNLENLNPESLAKAMVAFSELSEKLGNLTDSMQFHIETKKEDSKEMAKWKVNRAKKRKAKRKTGGKR